MFLCPFQVPGDVGFFTSGGMTATDYDDIELQKLIDFNTDEAEPANISVDINDSLTELANTSELSWVTVKPGDKNDSRSDSFNSSMQSVADEESEVLPGQSQNDDDIQDDDMQDDSEHKGSLANGKFLDTDRVVDILTKAKDGLKSIPSGLKENVYYIIDNEKNISKKENGKKSIFHDDCGVWDSGSGISPKTPYLVNGNGHLRKIYLRNEDGSTFNDKDEDSKKAYCTERQINKKRVYVPLSPQPDSSEVVTVQRYYASLSLDKNYKKRVTYFWEGGLKTNLALVEYIGKFPGLSAHGNSKSGNGEYIRTPAEVLDEMGELLKTQKPSTVYNTLKRKYDEVSRPTNLQQVRNKKRRVKKESNTSNGNNVADQVQVLENMVANNHNFVRTIIRDKNKTSTIILYNDDQIQDLKTFVVPANQS